MNLTLWSDASPGIHAVSSLFRDLIVCSYTLTPDESLIDGDYVLALTQPDIDSILSNPFKFDHNSTNDNISRSTQTSTSTTALFTPSAIHNSSLAPATATVTLVAAGSSSIPKRPDLQNSSASRHVINKGTIAGIVVGAVIFIILTTASAVLYRRRRRRFLQTAVSELPSNQTDADSKDPSATIWVPELGQEGAVYGPHELPVILNPLEGPLGATESCLAGGRVYEMAEPE